MKIGVVVDGQGEFRALPSLFPKIGSPHTLLAPLYGDMQPFAPIPQIVGVVKSKLPILRARGAQRVLVLLDRENRNVCPGAWATQLADALNQDCGQLGIDKFIVVVKNSCFENWLVADPEAFTRMPRRFSLSAGALASISPNKADNIDAQRLLKAAAQGGTYSKTTDAVRILAAAEPARMAANSRSFRKLLRELEHPLYLKESIRPAV